MNLIRRTEILESDQINPLDHVIERTEEWGQVKGQIIVLDQGTDIL